MHQVTSSSIDKLLYTTLLIRARNPISVVVIPVTSIWLSSLSWWTHDIRHHILVPSSRIILWPGPVTGPNHFLILLLLVFGLFLLLVLVFVL